MNGQAMIVLYVIVVVLVVAASVLSAMSARIIKPYERVVLLELRKVRGQARGPGLMSIFPFVDRVPRVSLRIVTMPIQSQGIITKDNVSIDVSAVAHYRVDDPVRSVVAIENVQSAINQIAQTTLRAVVRHHTLDETLSETEAINQNIREILDVQTEEWGVKVMVDQHSTVLFPAPLMSTLSELGAFLARTPDLSTGSTNGKLAAS